MDKKPSYAQAIAEIEQILRNFENEQLDVDALAGQVKRASELIKLCQDKLKKAEGQVAQVLEQQ